MAKKNIDELNLPAELPENNDLLADLEPLPEIRPLGKFDATVGTYRDSHGNPVQGPGVPEGKTGFFFISHAGDAPKSVVDAWIAGQRGFARASGVTIDGFPEATVLYCRYDDWLAARRAKVSDANPVAGDFGVEAWQTSRGPNMN